LELGYISEEQLASALAYQKKWQFVEIDTYAVDPQLLKIIPKSLAEAYRIFPLRLEDGTLHLAIDRIDLGSLPSTLENMLKVKIKFHLTTSYDISYAIEKAYSDEITNVVLERRLGELLLKDGLITQSDLNRALRRQKRTGEKLGSILVSEKMISPKVLERYLSEQRVRFNKQVEGTSIDSSVIREF